MNCTIFSVKFAVNFCKQCLQTASFSGGLRSQTLWALAPSPNENSWRCGHWSQTNNDQIAAVETHNVHWSLPLGGATCKSLTVSINLRVQLCTVVSDSSMMTSLMYRFLLDMFAISSDVFRNHIQ